MGFAEIILLSLRLLAAGRAEDGLAPFAHTAEPQLVALLALRRENLPHTLRGEIYPIAVFEGNLFRDASVRGVHPLTGAGSDAPSSAVSPLAEIRQFTVYQRAAPIGGFRVTGIEAAVYSCAAVQVGVGDMDLEPSHVRFGRLDPRVQTFAVSGPGVTYEYTLNYYLALSVPVSQPDFTWDSLSDPAATRRLRDAIREAAGSLAEPDGFRTFDLDGDGQPEAVGAVEAAIVWASDRGPEATPQILAVLEETPGGRLNRRRHLAEVMDLTGDGIAELFYQIDGIEHHAFEIHALERNALTEVFSGAGYGC